MSNTEITKDDPRLTAYALGELDGKDAELVAQALRADPELAAEFELIKSLTEDLSEELMSVDEPPRLNEVARQRIKDSAAEQPRRRLRLVPREALGGALVLRLCLVALILPIQLQQFKSNHNQVVQGLEICRSGQPSKLDGLSRSPRCYLRRNRRSVWARRPVAALIILVAQLPQIRKVRFSQLW